MLPAFYLALLRLESGLTFARVTFVCAILGTCLSSPAVSRRIRATQARKRMRQIDSESHPSRVAIACTAPNMSAIIASHWMSEIFIFFNHEDFLCLTP